MSTFSGVAIMISDEGNIFVVEHDNGVMTYKDIEPDSLLSCINNSLKRGRIGSGLLPKHCLSFAVNENGSKVICVLFPEEKADITFMETTYKDFPLPRLIFGFHVSKDGCISNSRLGVIEKTEIIKPDTKMYCWPLSNVSGTNICTGSNRLPKCTNLYTLASIPYLIIAMPNNLHGFSNKSNRMGMEMRELLELLKDKSQDYYYEHVLVTSGKTIKDFIGE